MGRYASAGWSILNEKPQGDLLNLGIFQVKRGDIETDQPETTVPTDLEDRTFPKIGHAAGKRPGINNEGVVGSVVSIAIDENGRFFLGKANPNKEKQPKGQRIKPWQFHDLRRTSSRKPRYGLTLLGQELVDAIG